jgi:hypothetical protein
MKIRNLCIAILATVSLVSTSAMAFDMPSLGGSSKKVDVEGLSKQQAEMLVSMTIALNQLSQAQSQMADAVGLKAESDTAKNTADALKNGNLGGKDDMEKIVTSTMDVQTKINDALKKNVKLDAQGSAKFSSALVPFGLGAIAMINTGKKTIDSAKSLITVTDPMVLSKLGTLMYVGSKAPSLMSSFGAASSSIIEFAKSNGIKTDEFKKTVDSAMGA